MTGAGSGSGDGIGVSTGAAAACTGGAASGSPAAGRDFARDAFETKRLAIDGLVHGQRLWWNERAG